jgi:plasmid stabilization system protein ParE
VAYRIVWSEFALDRVTEFFDFIARDNPAAAGRAVRDLFDRTQALAEHPRLGRRLSENVDSTMRRMVVGNYVLVYRIDDDRQTVLILAARHSRERPFPEEEG